jgi:hypothetical protein
MVEPSNSVYWRLPGNRLAEKLAEQDRPRVTIFRRDRLIAIDEAREMNMEIGQWGLSHCWR